MNDPKRIKIILIKIEEILSLFPSLRLGQLIVNLISLSDSNSPLFYLDDKEFEKCLDRFLEEVRLAENNSNATEILDVFLNKMKKH